MDIIASHQSGLIEQLEAEALALAGGPRESVQRAITCHHVADLLGLAHGYALAAAQSALALDGVLDALERSARWRRWGLPSAAREALCERAAAFADTLRRLDAERCADVVMAYRLVATPGLKAQALERLGEDLFAQLSSAQAARGGADVPLRRALFEAQRDRVEGLMGERVQAAIELLQWPYRRSLPERAVAALRIPAGALGAAERRGAARIDRALRASRRLPPGFAANPAQAFFKLQRQVAERRRRAGSSGEWCADDAVRLAA